MTAKVCPVLRRGSQILMFRHPMAGVQLVRGSLHGGETPVAGALRELREVSGLQARPVGQFMASSQVIPGQIWYFVAVTADRLPDRWVHHCADDGGHDFSFFWQEAAVVPRDAAPAFVRAIGVIQSQMPGLETI